MTSPYSPEMSAALVCAAYHLCNENRSLADIVGHDHKEGDGVFPHNILAAWTGQDQDACWAAVESAAAQDLIEYGTSLHTGWLTEKGVALLEQSELKPAALCMPTIKRQGEEFKDAMIDAAKAMSPEAQRRLEKELENNEGGQGATSPRPPGLRH